jgi:hypothetical protein
MKRIINEVSWKGQRYIMEWFSENNYDSLDNITQVYGTMFDEQGKICLIILNDKAVWSLPGGDIEKGEDWRKVLIEKADKNADITIDEKSIIPLGYIKVTPKNKDNPIGVHYLLRVAGKISKIKNQSKNKWDDVINERIFIDTDEFSKYCSWGKIGAMTIEKAKDAWKVLK